MVCAACPIIWLASLSLLLFPSYTRHFSVSVLAHIHHHVLVQSQQFYVFQMLNLPLLQRGQTPRDVAQQAGHTKLVRLLAGPDTYQQNLDSGLDGRVSALL